MTYTTVAAPRYTPSFTTPRFALWRMIEWYQSYRTRKALYALSDRQLDDIGLVRADINTL